MSDVSEKITDPNSVQVVFVNQVIGQGHINNVINLTFGTARFTPVDGKTVETDMVVSARLRMDVVCAQQLRDNLDSLLKSLALPPKQEPTEH